MSNLHLIADELGDIRALIRTLKAREEELRRRVLDRRPNGDTSGARWALSVRHGNRRSLNRAALPPSILDDPKYWKETPSQTVVCLPLDENAEADEVIEALLGCHFLTPRSASLQRRANPRPNPLAQRLRRNNDPDGSA